MALRARLTTGSPFSQRPHTCATPINDRKVRSCQGLGGMLMNYPSKKFEGARAN